MAPLFDEETFCCDSSFDANALYSPKKKLGQQQQPQQDACSSSSIPTVINVETKPLHNTVSKSDDAFLYYSNDEIRAKAMKLQDVPGTVRTSDIKQRKTRLSFEVDDLTAMQDLLLGDNDMFGDEDEFDMGALIVDFPSREDASRSDLLMQLLLDC